MTQAYTIVILLIFEYGIFYFKKNLDNFILFASGSAPVRESTDFTTLLL